MCVCRIVASYYFSIVFRFQAGCKTPRFVWTTEPKVTGSSPVGCSHKSRNGRSLYQNHAHLSFLQRWPCEQICANKLAAICRPILTTPYGLKRSLASVSLSGMAYRATRPKKPRPKSEGRSSKPVDTEYLPAFRRRRVNIIAHTKTPLFSPIRTLATISTLTPCFAPCRGPANASGKRPTFSPVATSGRSACRFDRIVWSGLVTLMVTQPPQT